MLLAAPCWARCRPAPPPLAFGGRSGRPLFPARPGCAISTWCSAARATIASWTSTLGGSPADMATQREVGMTFRKTARAGSFVRAMLAAVLVTSDARGAGPAQGQIAFGSRRDGTTVVRERRRLVPGPDPVLPVVRHDARLDLLLPLADRPCASARLGQARLHHHRIRGRYVSVSTR